MTEAQYYLRVLDVHEGARRTYNAILMVRKERADELVSKRKRSRILDAIFGASSDDEYRQWVEKQDRVNVFANQFQICETLVNLCEGLFRVASANNMDPKKVTISVTFGQMAAIELGWEKMMDAWRDERAQFDELKTDIPMPKFVKDTDEEKVIEFDSIRYKSTDYINGWKEWTREPLL